MKKAVFLDTSTLGDDIDLSAMTDNGFDWTLYETSSETEAVERIRDAEFVVSNKAVVSAKAIESATQLKCICVPATGTNNIDLKAANAGRIVVSNCTAYGTPSVSQHVFALILSLATKLPEYRQAAADGRWAQSPMFCLMDFPVMELSGRTLGIVGYGELGRQVGRIGEAFGMNILVANRPGQKELSANRHFLKDLLPQIDVLSLHCPLTPDTENLIGQNELQLMKPEALLINCARGGIVNESDLADALKNGTIAGAGVDVLSQEPPHNGNVLLDPAIPNLIVTPHSAWVSREARQRLVQITADNIAAFIEGSPQNVVNQT